MARYQELHWYLGNLNTPEIGVPVLIRIHHDTKYLKAETPYRAVRIEAVDLVGKSCYLTWNINTTPTVVDATEKNLITLFEVYDWAYL